jgi:DNA-directed RNA polymerase subunit RPC12/RpoP
MELTCSKCRRSARVPDAKVPVGRSYIVCPRCSSRINIFKTPQAGSIITNLTGLRFLGEGDDLTERFCEPGEMWRVVDVVNPCPDKGRGRSCELENKGRCPNQRLVVRLRRDKTLYKTCLYRKGRRIFDKGKRSPVGERGFSSGSNPVPADE